MDFLGKRGTVTPISEAVGWKQYFLDRGLCPGDNAIINDANFDH